MNYHYLQFIVFIKYLLNEYTSISLTFRESPIDINCELPISHIVCPRNDGYLMYYLYLYNDTISNFVYDIHSLLKYILMSVLPISGR